MASVVSDVLLSFAGAKGGKFFRVSGDHVQPLLKPGASRIPPPTLSEWLAAYATLRHVWASPNTIWSLISLALYTLAPYDLRRDGVAASAPLSLAFFAQRFPLWLAAVFAYTAFWHVSLYWLGWGARPFIAGRAYSLDKVLHNMLWSASGVAIWVGVENVFAFLWATGRLAYMRDAEAWGSLAGTARFFAALALIPMWRDFHFYFAHRLLHYRPVYSLVHALHHRNTDVEPFAGLSMHPIEHLYYFSCVLPSLCLYLSPFALLFNGMHLLLSPAAGHSGWEDHMQASAFHYMHHRYFEFNYAGTQSAWLDVAFGSFKEAFSKEDAEDGAKMRDDAKATLRSVPALEFVVYLVLACACVAAWAFRACAAAEPSAPQLTVAHAAALAALASVGPLALCFLFGTGSGGTPILEKGPLSATAHVLAGAVTTVAPVFFACFWAARPAS
jgi:sterol desaturase/sphingolipid hydroxylase (fatty acid hydroxylase superfamily)